MIDKELLNLYDFKVNQIENQLIQDIFFIIRRMLLSMEKETITYEKELQKIIPIQPEYIDEEDDDDPYFLDNETEIELDHQTLQKFIGELGELGLTDELFQFDGQQHETVLPLSSKRNHFDIMLKNQSKRIIEDITEEKNKNNQQSIFSLNQNQKQKYDTDMIDELLNSFDAIQISRDTEKYVSKPMESSSTLINNDSELSQSISDSDIDLHQLHQPFQSQLYTNLQPKWIDVHHDDNDSVFKNVSPQIYLIDENNDIDINHQLLFDLQSYVEQSYVSISEIFDDMLPLSSK